ncbi:hypothetical protein L3Q82_014051, partial [Scortum barcoo]
MQYRAAIEETASKCICSNLDSGLVTRPAKVTSKMEAHESPVLHEESSTGHPGDPVVKMHRFYMTNSSLSLSPLIKLLNIDSAYRGHGCPRGRRVGDLRDLMPSTLEGQITMEKTPSYFVTNHAPKRIHSMARDIKLIIVVRNPVTRAISDYTQTLSKKPEIPTFEVLAFKNRTLTGGERLIVDPAGEMGKVQDFLGLKRIVTDKHFYFNKTKGFPCLKKPEDSSTPRCLGKSKGRTHPKIDPDVIRRLHKFYKPFNMMFYQMTGQNFEWELEED